jgi:hypothetical protein
MLILNGADTQARDSDGQLPLPSAIFEETVEEMKYGHLRPVLK